MARDCAQRTVPASCSWWSRIRARSFDPGRLTAAVLATQISTPMEHESVRQADFRGNILVFDVASGRQTTENREQVAKTWQNARFDSSGKYLIGHDWSDTTRVWHARSSELVLEFPGKLWNSSKSNNRLAYREESVVRVCELRTSQLFWHERGHEMGRNYVLHVEFHPRLPLAVSGGVDGVRIVNTETRTEVAWLPIGNVATAAFHPVDGSLVDVGALRDCCAGR